VAFRVPRFDRSIPIVEENRTPRLPFHQWWDVAAGQIEEAINGIQDALLAAGIALEAAADAQDAADTAIAAAASAEASAGGATGLTSVVNSGVDANPLTATDFGAGATINIAAHNRLYPDGSSVAVNPGSITPRAYSTEYWVYYDDPTRVGGAVSYAATTTEADAAQAGDRHLVGKITTPAALDPDTNGLYKKYPGLEGLV
jgi:hypothetical protein